MYSHKLMRILFMASLIATFTTCFGISHDQNAPILERQDTQVISANKETPVPQYLYKIVSPESWQKSQAQKVLETSSFDEDFIHLATEEQLPHVAQKFWNNKPYIILTLDTKKLSGRLIYETNPGGATLYYHLYEGNIPLEAVMDVSSIQNQP
jgi:uncharacterized protein (DUF952 family)